MMKACYMDLLYRFFEHNDKWIVENERTKKPFQNNNLKTDSPVLKL